MISVSRGNGIVKRFSAAVLAGRGCFWIGENVIWRADGSLSSVVVDTTDICYTELAIGWESAVREAL
jgi:hypothetical protein